MFWELSKVVKHVFCDLDGTLLKNFRAIEEEDIKALQVAQEKGIKISIATGRLDYEINMVMGRLKLNGYRISQNGALVFSEDNKLVYEKALNIEDVHTILAALKGENTIIVFQTANDYIVENKNSIIIDIEKSQPYMRYIENKNILNELGKYQFVTISLLTEMGYNIDLKKQLDNILPKNIVSYISSKYTLDITCIENSKGNGIKNLCSKNKINLNEIAVIGDSQNDISMFEITENSFVMREADLEVKKYAKHEVESVKNAIHLILNR